MKQNILAGLSIAFLIGSFVISEQIKSNAGPTDMEIRMAKAKAERRAKQKAFPAVEYRDFLLDIFNAPVKGYIRHWSFDDTWAVHDRSCRLQASIKEHGVVVDGQPYRNATKYQTASVLAKSVPGIMNLDYYSTPEERLAVALSVMDANEKFGCE